MKQLNGELWQHLRATPSFLRAVGGRGLPGPATFDQGFIDIEFPNEE